MASERGATSSTSAKVVEGQQRQDEALALRLTGKRYDDIAHQLGYADRSGAHRAVTLAIGRNADSRQDEIDELRDLEAERLDALQAACWPKAMTGHLLAIDRVLRICEQRTRLLGLNRPERIEVSGGIGDLDQAVRELIEEITAAGEGQPVPEE